MKLKSNRSSFGRQFELISSFYFSKITSWILASDCFFTAQPIDGAINFRNLWFNYHCKIGNTFVSRWVVRLYGRCSTVSNNCHIQINRSQRSKILIDCVIDWVCHEPCLDGRIYAPEILRRWRLSNVSTIQMDTGVVHGIRHIYVIDRNDPADKYLHGRKFSNQNSAVRHDLWKYYAKFVCIYSIQNVPVGGTNDWVGSMHDDILY